MQHGRGVYFGAGPAALPFSVLEEIQRELYNWRGLGLSILEVSHRSPEFLAVMDEARQSIRRLLKIPSNYHVLFIGGPARQQFSMIPENILAGGVGGYYITGLWSKMAYEEASRISNAVCIGSSEAKQYRSLPDACVLSHQLDYLYYTPNETVNGVYCPLPEAFKQSGLPVVADMTSCLMTEPLAIEDYALIFAGTQKNLGIAGLTVVIVRDDIIKANSKLATISDYHTYIEHDSLYATPPTFNIYVTHLVLKWIEAQGGIAAFSARHQQTAMALYSLLDTSRVYRPMVAEGARSIVNFCFELQDAAQQEIFLTQAQADGLMGLRGHRYVGGLRASCYNAMSTDGVGRLMAFMNAFEERVCHGKR